MTTMIRGEIALGQAQETLVEDLVWTDCTSLLLLNGESMIDIFNGYRDGSDTAQPTEIRVWAKNSGNHWSFASLLNPWLGQVGIGTPMRFSYWSVTEAAYKSLGVAYLTEPETAITPGGLGGRPVELVLYGRLANEDGRPTPPSEVRRTTLAEPGLVAYWPGEDASGSTVIASAVAGQPSAPVDGVQLAGSGDLDASDPVVTIDDAAKYLVLPLTAYSQPSPQQWSAGVLLRTGAEPAGGVYAWALLPPAGTPQSSSQTGIWLVTLTPGSPGQASLSVQTSVGSADLLAGAGVVDFIAPGTDADELWGRQVGLFISARQVGADVQWSYQIWYQGSSTGASGTISGITLSPVGRHTMGPIGATGWAFGHWWVTKTWIADSPSPVQAAGGRTGAPALARADQSAFSVNWSTAVSSETTPLGPMRTRSVPDQLREVAASVVGLMYEDRQGKLAILGSTYLDNRPAFVSFAWSQAHAARQISNTQQLHDRITAQNVSGDSITVDSPSPDDPASVGAVRPGTISVNLRDFTNFRETAELTAAVQGCREPRYEFEIYLHDPANATLRDALLADATHEFDVGSRVAVTSVPTYVAPRDIDAQAMGLHWRISQLQCILTINTRPAAPWVDMFTAESATDGLGRVDTDGSRLLAAATSGDTSLLVGTYGDPQHPATRWSTTAVPYDISVRRGSAPLIATDRATVTAVTNRTPAFRAAGTASHADNAAVTPGAVAGITAGDLWLIFAAVRSSGSGQLDTPAGWERAEIWDSADNVALFWRTYVAGDTTPAISPTAGTTAAGDTVSAQACAFQYTQPALHTMAVPLVNASAANIAYPNVGAIRGGGVALILAWKQDDFTSLSTPSGFTAIDTPSSTLGNDQGMGWWYRIDTTDVQTPAGTVTVTGGGAAISRATAAMVLGDVQTLTVTRSASPVAHVAGEDVRIWRAGRATRGG